MSDYLDSAIGLQEVREVEAQLIPALLEYVHSRYGAGFIEAVWNIFTLEEGVNMDPEAQPELESIFLLWFLFNWSMDEGEVGDYPRLPVAQLYMQEHEGELGALCCLFIKETCLQPYSFFEIEAVEVGRHIILRDLLLEQVVTVDEPQASADLEVGSVLYARTVTLGDVSILVGCAPLVIPATFMHEFTALREELVEGFPGYDRQLLLKFDIELRALYYDIRDEMFAVS